jgi:hypothetical protein
MPHTGHMSYRSDMASLEEIYLDSITSRRSVILGGSISHRSSGTQRPYWTDGGTVHDVHISRYVNSVSHYKTLMRSFVRMLLVWLRRLDAESISTFQSMYYVIFTVTSVLLIFFPDFHVQYVSAELGPNYYDAWVLINLICPMLTLIGRRLTTLSAKIEPGRPNPAYGAAWLQLCGDSGVWGNVLVYVSSMVMTGWWAKEIYVFAFLMMGVAGGAMFTARSMRRIMQIDRGNRYASRESGCQM